MPRHDYGWLLSLSGWRDEKAVERWRIATNHHKVQERTEIRRIITSGSARGASIHS
jgi:heme-degrading monooxygenase HmoA